MGKKTYDQVWDAYNAAQINEKDWFLRLLFALCLGVAEPEQPRGRTRLPLRDILFCMAYRVYSTLSCRRFMTDLRDAHKRDLISRVPQYNSIYTYFGMEELKPYLEHLVIQSSLPLKTVEQDFAGDSSGMSTSTFGRWIDVRFGNAKIIDKRKWVKVHVMCGVITNIITSVIVTDANAADSPYLKPMTEVTTKNFSMRRGIFDKAYSSQANLKLVVEKGGTPFIPFKVNAKPGVDPLWTRMYHFYAYNQEWFKEHYHKRSNVESTFSMIKAKFGGRLRSKTEVAQVNEVLCKVLCHNLCVLIQSIYELKLEVAFWQDGDKAA